jgi:hypothetical protein
VRVQRERDVSLRVFQGARQVNRRYGERVLWAGTALCLTIAAFAWYGGRSVTGPVQLVADSAISATMDVRRLFDTRLVALANRVVEGDPFRSDRRPAPLPYSRAAEGQPPPPPEPSAPPNPALVLRGTVGGPVWEALIEGIPGREGSTLVRSGELIAGLTVQRVSRDTVVVRGRDTAWTLTVGQPWPQ